MFKEVKKVLLERILLTSETRKVTRNSVVAKQGEKASCLYVIM